MKVSRVDLSESEVVGLLLDALKQKHPELEFRESGDWHMIQQDSGVIELGIPDGV